MKKFREFLILGLIITSVIIILLEIKTNITKATHFNNAERIPSELIDTLENSKEEISIDSLYKESEFYEY